MTDPGALAADLENVFRPLSIDQAIAWWELNTRNSPEVERRVVELELRRRRELSDQARFAAVRAAAGSVGDSATRRVLDIVAKEMGPQQVNEALRGRIVELEARIESTFVNHRGDIDGRRVNDNDIEQVLTSSNDSTLRQKAWAAAKTVGQAVAADLVELVRTRNEAAALVGHRDHYAMSLRCGELDEERLFVTLAEVDAATAGPFAVWKSDLDHGLAGRFGCAIDQLRPWHYDDPFFQEPPVTGRVDLDAAFADADLEELTLRTFDGIGLDVHRVVERSDLYGREGKNQHAFCISIDREDDVRVLSNNVPNERWMGTMLHEFGHAVYDLGVDRSLPFILREPAHMLTTEAVAMLFGRLVRDPAWRSSVTARGRPSADDDDVDVDDAQRAAMLVFARWVLVMTHFERALYADPEGDHDGRWWELVERFQLVRRPDPVPPGGWASKIHLAVAPVYYQNYLYGELLASQMTAAIEREAGGLVDTNDAGRWLTERVFAPGASKRWDHLVADATDEELTARHFVAQYCRDPTR